MDLGCLRLGTTRAGLMEPYFIRIVWLGCLSTMWCGLPPKHGENLIEDAKGFLVVRQCFWIILLPVLYFTDVFIKYSLLPNFSRLHSQNLNYLDTGLSVKLSLQVCEIGTHHLVSPVCYFYFSLQLWKLYLVNIVIWRWLLLFRDW